MVSIAAGVTLARLAAGLSAGQRIVRVMPNTPCLIGRGASALQLWASTPRPTTGGSSPNCSRPSVSRYEVPETQLDAVTGLSGSGPAFVYTMIELLSRGRRRGGAAGRIGRRPGRAHGGRRRGNGARDGRDAGRAPRSRDQPGRNDAGRTQGFGRKWLSDRPWSPRCGRRRAAAPNWENRPEGLLQSCRSFVASTTRIFRSTA